MSEGKPTTCNATYKESPPPSTTRGGTIWKRFSGNVVCILQWPRTLTPNRGTISSVDDLLFHGAKYTCGTLGGSMIARTGSQKGGEGRGATQWNTWSRGIKFNTTRIKSRWVSCLSFIFILLLSFVVFSTGVLLILEQSSIRNNTFLVRFEDINIFLFDSIFIIRKLFIGTSMENFAEKFFIFASSFYQVRHSAECLFVNHFFHISRKLLNRIQFFLDIHLVFQSFCFRLLFFFPAEVLLILEHNLLYEIIPLPDVYFPWGRTISWSWMWWRR